jgi:hypothetical protein
MADRRKSVTERDDPLALETLRIIGNLRDAQPLLGEFLKASQKFTQQLSAAVAAGGAMLEALAKLSEHQGGDVGEGIKHLFEVQKAMEEHRHQVVQAWNDQLQADLTNRLPTDKNEVATWEKNYKAKRANSVKALKKAEANQQKCNKPKPKSKAPEKAEESDRQLDQANAEHDRLLREELRDVVRVERRKYCRFIQQFGYLVDIQANMAQADLAAIATCRASLANLGESEELITGKARLLLNDEGTPPPAYVPSASNGNYAPPPVNLASSASFGSLSSASSRGNAVLAAPASIAQGSEISRQQFADYDPMASTAALLGEISAGQGSMDFQSGSATYVDYSQPAYDTTAPNFAGPPLDDLLKDDLWDLVNGGVAAAGAHLYSDAPPADADIAAALRDIDELAINL